MNPFIFAKVFADFQGAFYKKPLEARFGTAVPTLNTPTARRRRAVYHTFLSEKGKPKNFAPNEPVHFGESF